ncbi:hypothetical protein DB42_AQ00390 [Neochlamydia sp. EPS4]|nr:hypothetical protein DB42_AQ00390 [Neochlamydia sp. EPS4]
MAYLRECRTLAKHYLKGNEKEAEAFIKLMQQEFLCPNDAKRQLDKFVKKLKYIQIIEPRFIATQKHTTSGRPEAAQKPSISSYRLQDIVACSLLNKLADALLVIRIRIRLTCFFNFFILPLINKMLKSHHYPRK